MALGRTGAAAVAGGHIGPEQRLGMVLLQPAATVVAMGETELSQSVFVNGLKRLPIRFELEMAT